MKRLIHTLALAIVLSQSPALAQDKPDKPDNPVPMKQVPLPGTIEIDVTAGEREKSFSHPSKALTEIVRSVSRAKRAKEGEEPLFETKIRLNDQVFTFSDPEAALDACKALGGAMRDLPKLRMGLGDLGEIPQLTAEEIAAATPMQTGKSRAAAIAEVRRRIQMAVQKQLRSSGGRPNPQAVQKIYKQEIAKAQEEGLLPSANSSNATGGDSREARKEAIVQMLALILSRADSVAQAEAKPADGQGAEATPSANGAAADEATENEFQ